MNAHQKRQFKALSTRLRAIEYEVTLEENGIRRADLPYVRAFVPGGPLVATITLPMSGAPFVTWVRDAYAVGVQSALRGAVQ